MVTLAHQGAFIALATCIALPAYGQTSKDGMDIKENPVKPADFMATIVKALGINPEKQNNSNVGRPIGIVEKGGSPIKEVTG